MGYGDKSVSPCAYTPAVADASGLSVAGGLLLEEGKIFKPANPNRLLTDPTLYGKTFQARMAYFYEKHANTRTATFTKKNATSVNKSYMCAVATPDGKVVFGPYAAAHGVAIYDPSLDSITILEAGNAGLATCVSGVLHPNGKAYFLKYNGTTDVITEVDTSTNTVTLWGSSTGCTALAVTKEGNLIWANGTRIFEGDVVNRTVSEPAYTGKANVRNVASCIVDNLSGDVFMWNSGDLYGARINTGTKVVTQFTKPNTDSYAFGCALNGFGYFFAYATPFGISKVNLSTGTSTTISTANIASLMSVTMGPNGRFYALSYQGSGAYQLIEFDPVTEAFRGYPFPMSATSTMRDFAVATNGKLYAAPYNMFNVWEIDLGVGSDFDWNIHGSIYGKGGTF